MLRQKFAVANFPSVNGQRHFYHRFRFYATIGGFSLKEKCVLAAVNHRYHIRKCTDWGELTVFSYRWRVVHLFSEGFRVQDIATILRAGCMFLKVNQVVQRDFNCKLSSWSRGGVAKQGTWMVCLYYVLYWFPSRDPANLQIKYHINWSCFPFYVQLANDFLLIENIISNTPRHI